MKEFTNEAISKMAEKLEITKTNAGYFYRMAVENLEDFNSNLDKYNDFDEVEIDLNSYEHHKLIGTGKLEFGELDLGKEKFRYLKPIRKKYKVKVFKNTPLPIQTFINKSNNMKSCLDLMVWDKYEKNKLLDLQRVNRCKDRFCPNCRAIASANALGKFEKPFFDMLNRGYSPYLITLTVPNVHGSELKETIERMQKAFRKFYQWLSLTDKNAFKNRIFIIPACVKALEVTVEKRRSMYFHPHYHVISFIKDYNETDFICNIYDGYSRKTKSNRYISKADVFISKLWTFAYENIRISNWDKLEDNIIYTKDDNGKNIRNYYQCDIRELEMPKGLYEVFKYVFKDTDIKNYHYFKYIYNALERKRIRQGHGELYNYNFECEEEEMEIDREDNINTYLEIEETPQVLLTRKLEELNTNYSEWKKISRFKHSQHIEHIK